MEDLEVKNIVKGKNNILGAYVYMHQNIIKTNSLCRGRAVGRPAKMLECSLKFSTFLLISSFNFKTLNTSSYLPSTIKASDIVVDNLDEFLFFCGVGSKRRKLCLHFIQNIDVKVNFYYKMKAIATLLFLSNQLFSIVVRLCLVYYLNAS